MGIYITLLLILIVLYGIKPKLPFLIPCILVFLVSAFRSPNVGTDTINYVNGFVANNFRDHMTEIGFLSMSGILRSITKSEFWFLFITSLIALFPVFYVIKKISVKPYYSILIFTCIELVFWLSGMRQAIALSFYTLFLYFAINNHKMRALLAFLISLSFHFSVLITIPVIMAAWLIPIYNHRKKIMFIILITAILGITKIFTVNQFIPLVAGLMGVEKYAYYAIYAFNVDIPVTRLFIQIAPISFFALVFLKYSNKEEVNLLTSLFIYGTIINNLVLIHPIGFRMAKYFSLLLVFMAPACLLYIKKGVRVYIRLGFLFLIMTYFVYGLYSRLKTDTAIRNDVVPYEFIQFF